MTLETPEEKDAFRHIKQMSEFAGNYQGPLYAPHPDIKRDLQTKEDQVAPQSEPRD